MLALTHLLLVLLLISWFGLDRKVAFSTILFGVLIDIDHIIGIVEFVGQQGWGNVLNIQAALESDIQWKSLLHSPEGIMFVAPVVLSSRMVIPLVAWSLHLVMDHVQVHYLGIMSPVELLIMALLALCLLLIDRSRYVALGGRTSMRPFFIWESQRAVHQIRSLPLLRRIRMKKEPQGTVC